MPKTVTTDSAYTLAEPVRQRSQAKIDCSKEPHPSALRAETRKITCIE